MQFSQKTTEHINSCRFCWMCHHVCPIGNATGLERNTARARALGLSMVERGSVEYSDDIVNNVYECSLCGACMKDCVTGWDPVSFTKEARLVAALEGKLPAYVDKMLENIETAGNVYGLSEIDSALTEAIGKHNAKTATLLYIGKEASYRSGANAANAAKVLEKAGVEFTMLENEPGSGYDMEFLVGAAEETRQTAIACAEEINKFDTVVCYTPEDAMMFVRQYKEWGIDVNCKVVTFTAFATNLISEGKLSVSNSGKAYTLQDPVHLARDLEELDCARAIIAACGENRDMLLCKKDTMLGGNLIMNEYMPNVMKQVANDRWNNAKGMNAETVVTACPGDYEIMKSVKPEGMEIITIEELILNS